MQYLYHDGDRLRLHGHQQLRAALDRRRRPSGDAKNYLLEGQNATVALHEGNPLYLDLPASVELEITYTEPGLQGDRSTGGTKPATVETGLQIQVPLFLTTGEKVKVDTRTGDYLGRVGSEPDRRDYSMTRTTHSSTQTKARKRALDILFEAELRDVDPLGHPGRAVGRRRAAGAGLHRDLVQGVVAQPGAIDARIVAALADGWSLSGCPGWTGRSCASRCSRSTTPAVPDAVAVSEAVGLVSQLSTDDSPTFVNGVLRTVVETKTTPEPSGRCRHRLTRTPRNDERGRPYPRAAAFVSAGQRSARGGAHRLLQPPAGCCVDGTGPVTSAGVAPWRARPRLGRRRLEADRGPQRDLLDHSTAISEASAAPAPIRKISPVASPYAPRMICTTGRRQVGQVQAGRGRAAAADPQGGQPVDDQGLHVVGQHRAEHRDARALRRASGRTRRWPRWRRCRVTSTVFCTASTRFCIMAPTPRPIRAMPMLRNQIGRGVVDAAEHAPDRRSGRSPRPPGTASSDRSG